MRRVNKKDAGKLTGFNAACAKFVRCEFSDDEKDAPPPARTKKKLAATSSHKNKRQESAKQSLKSSEIDRPLGLLDIEDTAQLELEHAFFGWLHNDGGAFLDDPLEDELFVFSGNLDDDFHASSLCVISSEETLKSPTDTPLKDQAVLITRGRRRRRRSSLEFQSLLESIADIRPETDRTRPLM